MSRTTRGDAPHDFFDRVGFELAGGETDDTPAEEPRGEVLFAVGGEARAARVAAVGEDAAVDLEENPRWDVGEVSPPAPLWVEEDFAFERRAVGGFPEAQEGGFEAGACGPDADADAFDEHAPARGVNPTKLRRKSFLYYFD